MQKQNLSCRVYEKLLFAYPPDFRQTFGSQMVQVFRDSYLEQRLAGRGSLLRLWLHTIEDLVCSALKERTESENSFMNNMRRDVIGILGCLIVIAIAFCLLGYGRKNEISSILTFGYFLDALVTTGIVGNLVIFLLAKVTRFDRFRTALYTMLIVHAVPLIFLVLLIGRSNPGFNKSSTIIGYVGSFLFWTGLHWMWTRNMSRTEVGVSS